MKDIITDIKRGDKQAFREFFEDYYPVLCSFAGKYIFDAERCRDVSQEVLLKFWEERARFGDLPEARAFLYVSTKNACYNLLRHERAADRYVRGAEPSLADNFEEKMMAHEVVLLLHKAIGALPGRMREIIELSLQGMRGQDIARELGITEGSVHTLKKIAYKKLRVALKDHFYLLLLL
jgi:RNA polymerase sigma-70 factor (ECF subfamily)